MGWTVSLLTTFIALSVAFLLACLMAWQASKAQEAVRPRKSSPPPMPEIEAARQALFDARDSLKEIEYCWCPSHVQDLILKVQFSLDQSERMLERDRVRRPA